MGITEAPGGGDPPESRRIAATRLEEFVHDILCAAGLQSGHAAVAGRLMVAADARGADGHGVFRLPQYVRRIESGGINVRPDIRVVQDHPAAALLDGDNGMGHVVMSRAADLAIGKARAAGLAWVGVRGSNHAGPAALYAAMALEHDMIGIYLAIGNANHMAPWGGTDALLSTNPIAIAVPARQHPPVILDMATTAVAYGRVKRTIARGEAIPAGWLIDRTGHPLTDPGKVGEGTLLPAGGYKGYGLALMFGLLAGTLNGAAFGRSVVDFNSDFASPTNTGHAIMAVDVSCFADVASFKAHVDAACEEITSSRPIEGGGPVRIPGERSAATLARSLRDGVLVSADVIGELNRLAASYRARQL